MNRSLTLLAAVLACATFVPSAAAAAPREIPSGNYLGVSVSEGFAYSVVTPENCARCQRFIRTNIATGEVAQLGQLPKDRKLFSLHVGGGRAIVGTFDGRQRTAVYEFRSGADRRLLIERNWKVKSKRACGTVVYPGAVSPAGEVSWDLLSGDPPKRGLACGAGLVTNFLSRTFTKLPGRHSRLQAPVWKGHLDRLSAALPRSSFSRTIALNSKYVLLARTAKTALLVDRNSGKRSIRPFSPDADPGGYGNVLAGDGSTIGEEMLRRDDYAFARPILSTGGRKVRLEPYAPGNGSRAYFCGQRIVQVTSVQDPATEASRIAVVLRDMSGQPLLTLLAPGEADLGDFQDADCDAKTLVIQSTKAPDASAGTGTGGPGSGATGYFGPEKDSSAKTWAVDLP